MNTPEPAAPQNPQPEQPKQPSIYGEVPQIPVLDAVEGIKFDFNEGIRILFPHNGKEYHVTFTDIDTGIILYSADTVPGAYVTSVKKFYIKFRLIIDEKGGKEPIFTHDYDCKDKEVMIQLPVGTLGDSIGWFSCPVLPSRPMTADSPNRRKMPPRKGVSGRSDGLCTGGIMACPP